jgi:hypothetical protein
MGFNSGLKGLNAQLNPICHLPVLLGAHHILHGSRIRVKIAPTCFGIVASSSGSALSMLAKVKLW